MELEHVILKFMLGNGRDLTITRFLYALSKREFVCFLFIDRKLIYKLQLFLFRIITIEFLSFYHFFSSKYGICSDM